MSERKNIKRNKTRKSVEERALYSGIQKASYTRKSRELANKNQPSML
jgi:hypothetical protein